MGQMPNTTTTAARKGLLWPPPWYYATRVLGAVMVVYGLFVDKSDIRGEIILAGAGLAGFDKVSRSDSD